MTMRHRSKVLNLVLLGLLTLSTVLVAVPAMAATSSVSWDFERGLNVPRDTEVSIAQLTHDDVAGSECTLEITADNQASVHRPNDLRVYLNGVLVLTLEDIEAEPFQMNQGSVGFVSSGSDLVEVFLISEGGITSTVGDLSVDCTPPQEGGEGCTPGYWKQTQHFDSWVGYSQGDSFSGVFGVPYEKTLLEAAQTGGGGEKALGRHAVAALLNASSPDVSYAYTTAEVIALVQDAWATGDYESAKNLLEVENELGCPLN
jgi:hypothetical protein